MKIEEICDYLNELGILSIKNIPLFLSIYASLVKNNDKNKDNLRENINIDNNKLTTILFAFLKKINSNDKELYELCSNIIDLHSKNKLIKQYQGICFLNKVIFYQIKNRFNHFLFLLFKKKYPKRKYFPYNPQYAAKSASKLNDIKPNISFTNLNPRRNNNFLNLNEEHSLSYISNRNNNRHYNKIVFNTNSDEVNKNENTKKKINFEHPPVPISDIVEKMNNKKKEISMNNMRKKLYDAQIRINNYENIIPISRRNRAKEQKSREEEDYFNKLKEDKIYQKLTEKELDQNNILDRLYRREIIKKQEMKMKEKENKKRSKSPIDWDKINSLNSKKNYLNININSQDINSIKEIINKPKKNNFNSSREMFSFGTVTNKNGKIDYNEFIKNKKENLDLNRNFTGNIWNKNQQNQNPIENNNKNLTNYLNLKQLDENEIEENIVQNKANENNFNDKNENENNININEKYTLGNLNDQNNNNGNNNLLKNENYNNKGNEIDLLTLNNNNIQDDQNENDKIEEYQGNEAEENEEEELINNNNNNPLTNEQFNYENRNNEDENEEENENEDYEIENEEIEYDLNHLNNIMEDNNNINENEKIGNENINYEDVLEENIEEYLNEENNEK